MTQNTEKAVLSKLAEVAKSLTAEVPAEPEQPIVIKLDTEDVLRLENMMLSQQVAKMSIILAEKQTSEAQLAFQNHLIAKFEINSSKYQMQVNPTEHTVTLVPR